MWEFPLCKWREENDDKDSKMLLMLNILYLDYYRMLKIYILGTIILEGKIKQLEVMLF